MALRVHHLCFLLVTQALLLLFADNSYSQPHYNAHYITTENGLPSHGIKGLQWDETTGFLWIATESGLVRYNGHRILVFNKSQIPSLKTEKIFPITKSNAGKIYAVYNDSIFMVSGNTLIPSLLQKPAYNPVIGNLIYIHSPFLPLATSSLGIDDYCDYLPLAGSRCMILRGDTLWEYKPGYQRLRYITIIPHNSKVFTYDNNVFCYKQSGQFSVCDSLTHTLKDVQLNDEAHTYSIPAGKKNLYWQPGMQHPILLAGTSAWQILFENGRIKPILICTEIPQNFAIKYVQYWPEGDILFLGTTSKGIIILRKNYLTNIRKNISGFDEPNAIYSQILLKNGNILANTGDILGPFKTSPGTIPISGAFHNNVHTTADSVLWYARNDSLFNFSYKTGRTLFNSSIENSYNLAFAETEGNLFVANNNNIQRVHDTFRCKEMGLNGYGDPFDMAEESPGVLFLGTSRGLFRYHTKLRKIDTVFTCEAPVRSLWKYGQYTFAGTYGSGIYIIKNGLARKIPLDNNHYLLYTHCFMIDTLGFCWLSTNRGLFKALLSDMLSAYENGSEQVYYHFFGVNEGMEITEMNGGCTPCAIKLSNNDISFPTMDGALWVAAQMPLRMPYGKIFIDRVMVNEKAIALPASDSLFLKAGANDIEIMLGCAEWCNSENIYLQYKLDNNKGDTSWIKIDADNPHIHLSNPKYGHHKLLIRSLIGFGPGNYKIIILNIYIDTPWFLKWWGASLIIMSFLGIITIISIIANSSSLRRQVRLRNQLDKKTQEILIQNEKLEKNDQIKTRLISIISHDIITPLKFLHLTSKYLSEEKSNLPENLRNETLAEVVNTSRELELLSTNILNWIKYQNEERRIVKEELKLRNVAEHVFVILKSLANKNNIELINLIPEDITAIQYVEPIRIILYNLVVNAINFTIEGKIIVQARKAGNNVQLEVKDSGIGMSRAQISNIISDHTIISSANVNQKSGHGLGYLIIKDLLKMIDGAIHIESKQGLGTTVQITFPAE